MDQLLRNRARSGRATAQVPRRGTWRGVLGMVFVLGLVACDESSANPPRADFRGDGNGALDAAPASDVLSPVVDMDRHLDLGRVTDASESQDASPVADTGRAGDAPRVDSIPQVDAAPPDPLCVGMDSKGTFSTCAACSSVGADCDTLQIGASIRRACGCSQTACPCGLICGCISIAPGVEMCDECTRP